MTPIPFALAGRVPEPGDNAAIAVRRLDGETVIAHLDQAFRLPHTVLEGHRFAIQRIARGERLMSWGLPFGTALRDIEPGDYVCNRIILEVLQQRHVQFPFPSKPNFEDLFVFYELDESTFRAGLQVPRAEVQSSFRGFERAGGRGAGTRNYVVVIGTSSWTASYARALAARFKDVPSRYPNIDGVVAVAHTEGGGRGRPNNYEFVLRSLAGYCVHPNVGAFLAADMGNEPVTNAALVEYLREHGYPIHALPNHFLSVGGNFPGALEKGATIVRSWLEPVNQAQRTVIPADRLKVALQCGGSDAFSGVSGNPLAGWVAKEVIRRGGAANLAETDELIGAETYVLSNTRDLATARKFIATLKRFQERASWHGHSAEGNPSGGNLLRGLYNITIKSIGAARKKDPQVCLDHVIEYGERMRHPGFYFMDSPGNDLESIAGQVASGCNLILFTTGNGSITNFPFVPTIKIMTNSGRYRMLTQEMDVNAGAYLDGQPMDQLGAETFELALRIASGEKSAGERAGHSQVQIWREWRQTDGQQWKEIQRRPQPDGQPLTLAVQPREEPASVAVPATEAIRYPAFRFPGGLASDRVGLIVPTSLCSGQVGRMIAERLNRASGSEGLRYVALPHTEGCGVSGGESEVLHLRTMMGYLIHPLVFKALVLEHGCEKTHNDALRNFMEAHGIDRNRFGWASVQLDGGIESVTDKAMKWFLAESPAEKGAQLAGAGLESVKLGCASFEPVPPRLAAAMGSIARRIVESGGSVVVAENAPLLESSGFKRGLLGDEPARTTLAYGEPIRKPGLHIMETPTDHAVETLTGLGATGVEVILAGVANQTLQCHPLIPLVQVGATGESESSPPAPAGLDLITDVQSETEKAISEKLLGRIVEVLARKYQPQALRQGNADFQVTRGWLGVSL